MVWRTKTQNSGNRLSREKEREELQRKMRFRNSEIKKDNTKPGWQCKKIQEKGLVNMADWGDAMAEQAKHLNNNKQFNWTIES